MLAADTNVVLRLLLIDDVAQHRAVANRIRVAREAGESVLVSPVVLAEVSWVLDSAYGYPRGRIADAIEALLETPPFEIRERAGVLRALACFRSGPADFSDYLVLARALDEGAGGLLTFDKDLLKQAGTVRP